MLYKTTNLWGFGGRWTTLTLARNRGCVTLALARRQLTALHGNTTTAEWRVGLEQLSHCLSVRGQSWRESASLPTRVFCVCLVGESEGGGYGSVLCQLSECPITIQ